MDAPIYHLVSTAYFRAQVESQPYYPELFVSDGFIHATAQVDVLLHVANAFYKNVPGEFLVLVIDPTKLTAELKYEPPAPLPPPDSPLATVLFPHIYGGLNRDAIVEIRVATRAEDGTFVKA